MMYKLKGLPYLSSRFYMPASNIQCKNFCTSFLKYYKDYSELRAHFLATHYLCEMDRCSYNAAVTHEYVVFRNELDLQAHKKQIHAKNKIDLKNYGKINIEFNVRERDGGGGPMMNGTSSGVGAGRGRGNRGQQRGNNNRKHNNNNNNQRNDSTDEENNNNDPDLAIAIAASKNNKAKPSQPVAEQSMINDDNQFPSVASARFADSNIYSYFLFKQLIILFNYISSFIYIHK